MPLELRKLMVLPVGALAGRGQTETLKLLFDRESPAESRSGMRVLESEGELHTGREMQCPKPDN